MNIPHIEPPTNPDRLNRQITALEAAILTDTEEFSLQVHKQALKDLKAKLEEISSSSR